MLKDLAPIIVPLIVAGLLVRRAARARTVRLRRMWIAPAIFALLTAAALAAAPLPSLLMMGVFVAAAAVGGGLGFLRAHHQHLSIDPETGVISSRTTTVGSVLVAILFVARFGLKTAFPQLGVHGHGGAGVVQWSNAFLIFTVAMLIARTAWTHTRTQPLLAEHAARTSATAESTIAKS